MVKINSAVGLENPFQEVFPNPVIAQRAPTSSDKNYPFGQLWVDKTNSKAYVLVAFSAGSPVWNVAASSSGALDTLDADSGSATPSGGAIDIAGGANITTSATGATVTAALDSAITLTTVNATTFDTNVAAAAVTLSGTTLAADGTDADISITLTPKGTGTLTVDSGGILASAGNISASHAEISGDVIVSAINSDNTMNDSQAIVQAQVGGTSAGDALFQASISGGETWSFGIDNSSTNDDFVISDSGALGTSNVLEIDGSTGIVTLNNGLTSGGVTSINDSVNANTTINTGTSTGTVAIGNGSAGTVTVDSGAAIELTGSTASFFSITGASEDLTLNSTNGRVLITGGEAVASAVTVSAGNASGGVTIDAGATPGVTFTNGTQSHQMLVGSGSPNGSVTAAQGSLYVDVSGSTSTTILFANTDGATTWVGVGA